MHITINQSTIKPATVVRDLGVLFDGELSYCNAPASVPAVTDMLLSLALLTLRSLSQQLGRDVTANLVSAFVLTRLDCCNAVLTGLSASTLAPLQRVLNAAGSTGCGRPGTT